MTEKKEDVDSISKLVLDFKYQNSIKWEVWKIIIFLIFILYLYAFYKFCFNQSDKTFIEISIICDIFFLIHLLFKIIKLALNFKNLQISSIIIELCLNIPIHLFTVFPYYLFSSIFNWIGWIKLLRTMFIWETIENMNIALKIVYISNIILDAKKDFWYWA